MPENSAPDHCRCLDSLYGPCRPGEGCKRDEGLRVEYLVVGAPGWPGGITPHPNTQENAEAFVGKHGGVLRWRVVSDWKDGVPHAR